MLSESTRREEYVAPNATPKESGDVASILELYSEKLAAMVSEKVGKRMESSENQGEA